MTDPIVDDRPKEPVVANRASATGRLKIWANEHLFGSVKDTILTIVFGVLLGWLAIRTFQYAFINARWEVIIDGPLHVYMVGGRFNETGLTYTHIWVAIYLLAAAGGWVAGLSVRNGAVPNWKRSMKIAAPALIGLAAVLAMTRTITPTLLVLGGFAVGAAVRWVTPRVPQSVASRSGWILTILTVTSFLVLTGGEPGNVNKFGGLLLTIVVSAGGIVLSFPIGVIMALARRSSFPLIRPFAVGYIELIRGVPLITLLFMGQFALRFLFPPNTSVPGPIPRAIIVITLFTAAYVAEVVRGGLQSVPQGQTEAGQAVGLSPVKVTRLIVLPQALRNSIPALIGQFISLLKDTSLLVVIGIQDLLGITEVVLGQLQFRSKGYQPETFAFVGLIYWVITFTMSRASQRLESRLGVGKR